jgi:hypothetical protein
MKFVGLLMAMISALSHDQPKVCWVCGRPIPQEEKSMPDEFGFFAHNPCIALPSEKEPPKP